MLQKNPSGESPIVNGAAYISESAVIIGNVEIKEGVYVAPNATIRADEPDSEVIIGSGCNIQDNVVIHALSGSSVIVGNKTSLAHGCIVHGPCTIGDNCFIGFGSVLFNCTTGEECVILHRALVKDVKIPVCRMVEDGAVLNKQENVWLLRETTAELLDFAKRVVGTNLVLAESYSKIKGGT